MNEQKFTGKAEFYEKYRPSYPNELIDFLYENARCDAVCDIGAGTGKFTRCLLQKPWRVTAVEPNSDMRGKLSDIKGITLVNAPAENTGLSEHSFGLVTAAQAFHWFNEEAFKQECKRILTPNGKVAIIWNNFVKEGLAARQTELCCKFCADFKSSGGHTGRRSDKEGDEFLRGGYFRELDVVEFSGERVFDHDSFIGETLSRSYAPRAGEPNYEPLIDELNVLFSEFESEENKAAVKTNTVCYLGSF